MIDIYNRRARNIAWYDDEDGPPNRNPFKKFRTRPVRQTEGRAEDGLLRVRSEGDSISAPELERRQAVARDFPARIHPQTMPPASGGRKETHTDDPETSPVSTASIAPLAPPDHFSPEGPVQRSGFTNASTADTLKSDPADSSKERRNFNAVGQLKATLFNSWVNILLVAAPVGSKSPKLHLVDSKIWFG